MNRSKQFILSILSLVIVTGSLAIVSVNYAGNAVAQEGSSAALVNAPDSAIEVKSTLDAKALMKQHCAACHGPDKQKGDVRFDQLDTMNEVDRNELMNLAHEAVHFEDMPPDDEPQPTDEERKVILSYLSGQVGQEANKALKEKLRYPKYGNLVDHDDLFSGEIKAAAYTPARRWLVHPNIFINRVLDVFEFEGSERSSGKFSRVNGFTNPFVLPDTSGVSDYDTRMLTGGHLITMLGNAEWIAKKQIFSTEVQGKSNKYVNELDVVDKWRAKNFAPESFKAILENPSEPSEDELIAAINKQFSLVLRREPSEEELKRYIAFTQSMIKKGGNKMGLKQMLRSVLLESDFLYRVEFGGGEPDEHGRKMMTPREAAHAISYAIGDLKPDETLLKAAAEGRLNSKEDYRREVKRLLADEEYFRGVVDSRLSGSSARPEPVSHPKTIRFFREFFGYPMALAIFKDAERAEGKYVNLRRGTTGTPGAIVNEADQIVTWHVEKDQDVIENLLTSDKYFVYYRDSKVEKNKAIVNEWREVWNKLKDEPWETEPKKVYDENRAYLDSKKLTNILDNRRRHGPTQFQNTMYFFKHHFDNGVSPYPNFPWAHGNQQKHASLYSLPKSRQPDYYRKKHFTTRSDAEREEKPWDYPIEQPFSIPNRKGILSHPAWLIAHAQNFHTDPVRRGLWIQEKLLANRVPDVPITVDAKIPDHPDKTLRTRLHEKTSSESCWRCHKHMNPLGLPFEMYDDFGRFRLEEAIEYPENIIKKGDGKLTFNEYKTMKIDTSGKLIGTGKSLLDGEVEDALDLIRRVAKSDRARQSVLRHAFRFYMGRNEMLSDSQTLIDMDKAYLKSGGSFDAVIVSLLSSDSFMYRKEINPEK